MSARSSLGRAAALTVAALAVASCSLFEKEVALQCPRLAVLADAASLTRFAEGAGRDIIDMAFEAEIESVGGTCEYDIDDDTQEGTLDAQIAVTFRVSRGQANRDRKATFGYFVRLTDLERNILAGDTFRGVFEFPGNQSRIVWTDEPVTLTIPLKAKQTGRDFEVFVGLELTREEVDYNRKARAVRPR